MPPLLSTNKTASGNKSYFLFILVAIIAIGSGLLVQNSKAPPVERPEFKKTILLPNTKPLVDINFIDHNGQIFGLEQLKDKWSLLFFGFTNCPDVCPTTMQTLKHVKSKVKAAGAWHNYQVIMVSVDPERDTTERLANYVPYFDPEFIGISGNLESTASFAKNVGILFFKSDETANGGYDVDHGAAIILVNPEGEYAGVMTAPHIESSISADLIALAQYAGVKNVSTENNEVKKNGDNSSILTVETTDQAQALVFENAWIRPAPSSASNMAAYVDLINKTDQDIVLNQSNSPAFTMTMIHTTLIDNGIASMEHLDQLVVPANGRVSLAPMSTHLMLMRPKQSLQLGNSAEIILVSDKGVKYPHTFTVKPQPTQ